MHSRQPPQRFVSRAKAAESLNCSLRTISRYQQAGRLRFQRVDGRIKILRDDVLRLRQEPPASQSRIDSVRLRRMDARIMMLELKLAEAMEELDRRFAE